MRVIGLLTLCATALGGCGLWRTAVSVDCGPLDPTSCSEAVRSIESALEGEFPGRSIAEIEFLNLEGHADVVLDDGTVIGWGERLPLR